MGGEDRYRPDPQLIIQTKIGVNTSKEPISEPIMITRDPEDKREKISPAQHIIRTCWTKHLPHRGGIPQEYLRTDNNKFHILEYQSILVV